MKEIVGFGKPFQFEMLWFWTAESQQIILRVHHEALINSLVLLTNIQLSVDDATNITRMVIHVINWVWETLVQYVLFLISRLSS